MAKIITMPKVGNTVKTVILSEWFVKENEKITIGQKFYSYETDKTVMEEKSKEEAVVLKLLVKVGEEIPVFTPIAIIGQENEDISEHLASLNFKDNKQENQNTQTIEVVEQTPTNAIDNISSNNIVEQEEKKETVFDEVPKLQICPSKQDYGISPRALKLIAQSGIPLNNLTRGSGPDGRIIEEDIINLINSQEKEIRTVKENVIDSSITSASKQTSQVNIEPKNKKISDKVKEIISHISNSTNDTLFDYPPMRKAISKGLKDSLNNAASVSLMTSINANSLLKTRAKFKKEGSSITLNDLIVFALSRVIPKHKNYINAHVDDTKATIHDSVNIAIAVDAPPLGLIVPVIKNTQTMTLVEIHEKAKEAIKAARAGELSKIDLRSGTFTISNVGAMGIEYFTPILNAGQAAILGVGTSVLKPKLNDSNLIEFYNSMCLSLTVDHRLADGADGARFLNDLKIVLENIGEII
ncbi:MAG: 2-oxo acid dehydrogenase subunit E2 [Mycoplasma sp.]|nr:2-oxo acid dehydrogenase subunit E2 [Mycoplasma sp.]